MMDQCDLCGSLDGTRHIEVKTGGTRQPMQLCRKHAAPLDQLLADVARKREQAPRPLRKANRSAHRVKTLAEIEQLRRH
jgi:hypothetical protein